MWTGDVDGEGNMGSEAQSSTYGVLVCLESRRNSCFAIAKEEGSRYYSTRFLKGRLVLSLKAFCHKDDGRRMFSPATEFRTSRSLFPERWSCLQT